jgi:glutamate synthase (ferredoxin)
MSGGVAYVLDEAGDFHNRCNQDMVSLVKLEDEDEIEEVKNMIEKHVKYTKSKSGARVLSRWEEMVPKFAKVLPNDYARVLEALKRVEETGISGEEAVMAAFKANVSDMARVGGN